MHPEGRVHRRHQEGVQPAEELRGCGRRHREEYEPAVPILCRRVPCSDAREVAGAGVVLCGERVHGE